MQLPDYDFKLLPEALKAAGIALGIFLVTLLLDFNDDLDAILTDPEAYVRSMVPALLAVIATAFLGVMTRRRNGTAEIEKRLEELRVTQAPELLARGQSEGAEREDQLRATGTAEIGVFEIGTASDPGPLPPTE